MAASASSAIARDLGGIVGDAHVLGGAAARPYGSDGSVNRGLRGWADVVVLPGTADEVAAVLRWCYEHDVPLVPRGGGTGVAGGALAEAGEVVCSLERLARVRSFEPERWRMHVEAGVTTGTVHRLAREHGLLFPPDPGASEQSQIGGNVATNAGGPHAFKYGATGAWVTGLEVALAPGELVRLGGPARKDVAGYDLRSLLIGSEGTLGLITAAWLRLVPAPEATLPMVGFYPSVAAGCAALDAVFAFGLQPAVLDFADGPAFAAAAGAYPGERSVEGIGFVLLVELDGGREQVERDRGELREALGPGSLLIDEPPPGPLWRWRDGMSGAVTAQRGAKLSEDIAVPVERLAEAIDEVRALAARHGLEGCSWGHGGDGILHATFLFDAADDRQREAAELAAEELFELAIRLGGSITGEHGVGLLKRGALERQWQPAAVGLHEQVKALLDPKGLLNPGKKVARAE